MGKDLISMEYWREAHLLPLLCPTDVFYVKYARKLRDKIRKADCERKLSPEDMTEIALTLTYYLEDVVSGLGGWRSFIMEHKRMYGRYLPFYETGEDYYIDEVNEGDVRFLIWMIFQKRNQDVIVNPENSYLQKLAHDLFEALDEDFEQVPINAELLDAMKNPVLYQDFYNMKTLMIQVCCMSYLFYYFTAQHRDRVVRQVNRIVGEGQPLSVIEYMTESILGVHEKTGPLALKPQVWLSRMLEFWGMNDEANALKQMETRELQPYRIVETDESQMILEDWQEQRYELSLKDLLQAKTVQLQKQKVLLGSLVKYKDRWYPNGGVSWLQQDAKFIKYKEQKAGQKQQNEAVAEEVMRLNGGKPFLFFEHFRAMKDWMKKNLKDHTLVEAVLQNETKHEEEKNIVMFVSPRTGIVVLPEGACCICHDDNPFYKKEEAEANAVKILFDAHYSAPEMVHSLVREHMLPDAALFSEAGPERGRALLQENVDFLLRVIRPDF